MGDDEKDERDRDDEEEGEQVGLPKTQGRSKIVTILLMVAGALGAIILMIIISYFMAKIVKGAEYEENQNISVVKAPPPLSTWAFTDEFRVNTADTDATHFVKMSLAFGYDSSQIGLQNEFNARVIQLKDLINIILQGKKKADLTGPQNQLDLREEIKSYVNHILREGMVQDVYFTEFIVN